MCLSTGPNEALADTNLEARRRRVQREPSARQNSNNEMIVGVPRGRGIDHLCLDEMDSGGGPCRIESIRLS